MSTHTFVFLFCFFWFQSNNVVESRIFHWTGYSFTNNFWSDSRNWNCVGCGNGAIPTITDDVIINSSQSVGREVNVNGFGQCRSLTLYGPINLSISSYLGVGELGISSSKESNITILGSLSSQGDVYINGTCNWRSGDVFGPGNYKIETLYGSVCQNHAHIHATSVNLFSITPTVNIQVFPNAWLYVDGSIRTARDNPTTLSGNITTDFLYISHNLTFSGNVTQIYRGVQINILNDLKIVVTVFSPISIGLMSIPVQAQVLIYADANLTAESDGSIEIFPGANVILQFGPVIKITTAGNLTLNSTFNSNGNTINVTGGSLNTLRNGGNGIQFQNLYLSRAKLVGDIHVTNTLVLRDETNLLGSLTVLSGGNVDVSGIQNYAGKLTLQSGSKTVFDNCQVFPFESYPVGSIINEGTCNINGNFHCRATVNGSGEWNVNGQTWFVEGSTHITGTIYLKEYSILNFAQIENLHSFGSISGGSIISNGAGNFIAKNVDVNSFYDDFSHDVTIDSLTTTNYTSNCCANRAIKTIKVENLFLEKGNYKINMRSMKEINNLKLDEGVELTLNIDDDINTFDFFGGFFSGGSVVNFHIVNTIGNATKQIRGNFVQTDILDWTKCVGDCGVSLWSNFVAVDCICPCSQCNANANCAPCLNDNCSPCSRSCACPGGRDCDCNERGKWNFIKVK